MCVALQNSDAGAVGIGSLIVKGASGIFSAISQANASDSKASYYKSLAEQNAERAKIALHQGEIQSTLAQNEGAQLTKRLKIQGSQFEGTQKAGLAANGVSADSVTAQNILQDTISKEALDEAAIRYNADQKSFEAKNAAALKALDFESQASQYRVAAENAKTEGGFNAASTLLNTATSVADTWYKMSPAKTTLFNRPTEYEAKGMTPFRGSAADFFNDAPDSSYFKQPQFEFRKPKGPNLFGG